MTFEVSDSIPKYFLHLQLFVERHLCITFQVFLGIVFRDNVKIWHIAYFLYTSISKCNDRRFGTGISSIAISDTKNIAAFRSHSIATVNSLTYLSNII